jgi:hypothetical protein
MADVGANHSAAASNLELLPTSAELRLAWAEPTKEIESDGTEEQRRMARDEGGREGVARGLNYTAAMEFWCRRPPFLLLSCVISVCLEGERSNR